MKAGADSQDADTTRAQARHFGGFLIGSGQSLSRATERGRVEASYRLEDRRTLANEKDVSQTGGLGLGAHVQRKGC
jgi:hypothetical protein